MSAATDPAAPGTPRETAPAARVEVGLGMDTVSPGDHVLSWYDDEPVEYGGPDADRAGWTSLTFALLAGGLPVRKCDADHVAPAAVPVPVKDDRVTVVKVSKADTPYGVAGSWRLTLPGIEHPSWHRTKRDATATGLRRLAILDWHTKPASPATPPTELVTLPHTGLRVPDPSLRITALRQLRTFDGVAFQATLRLGATIVGTVENDGRGGSTMFRPHTPRGYGFDEINAFAAACVDRDGRPASTETVLNELVDEYDTPRIIARDARKGRITVRLMAPLSSDGTATYCTEFGSVGAPSAAAEHHAEIARAVAKARPAQPGEWWQVWTGTAWHDLPVTGGDAARAG